MDTQERPCPSGGLETPPTGCPGGGDCWSLLPPETPDHGWRAVTDKWTEWRLTVSARLSAFSFWSLRACCRARISALCSFTASSTAWRDSELRCSERSLQEKKETPPPLFILWRSFCTGSRRTHQRWFEGHHLICALAASISASPTPAQKRSSDFPEYLGRNSGEFAKSAAGVWAEASWLRYFEQEKTDGASRAVRPVLFLRVQHPLDLPGPPFRLVLLVLQRGPPGFPLPLLLQQLVVHGLQLHHLLLQHGTRGLQCLQVLVGGRGEMR